MYHIAILTDNNNLGHQLAEWTKCFCSGQDFYPVVELFTDSELFFESIKKAKPDGVIVALFGVAGLNASEQLRSLCPECGLIWCSDLDFSLQAYRLRAEYFFKAPPTNEEFCKGLSLWIKPGNLHRKKSKMFCEKRVVKIGALNKS